MSEYTTQQQDTTTKNFYDSKVVPAAAIAELWSAQDPNANAQELFKTFLSNESAAQKVDLNKWDDCESRFEPNELKWIADFIVNNLVFCRETMNSQDDEVCAKVMQLLWDVLNLFGEEQDLPKNMASRYQVLQTGLKQMFVDKVLT